MATEAIPVDRIQKAFEELESQKTLIENCTLLWKNLSDHFSSLEQSITQRSQALDSKLQDLDSQTNQTLENISQRESSIPSVESAATALVEQRRDAALSELNSASLPLAGAPFDLPGSLRRYCRRMDSVGLWRFMVSRRRDLAVLRKETTDAVLGSVDPARLVLDAVEDFVECQEEGGGADRCWACGMLLRTLFDEDGRKPPKVSVSIRERAGAVAEAWKKKMDERGEGGVGGSEAQLFLQLVVAFGVPSRVEEEFLKKLLLEFASRNEIPKLAAGLGFGEKMGDIIDELIKTGKEIDAVYFAYESGLTELFSPVSLLKSYLQNSRKNANAILKGGNHSMAATDESSTVELNAVRSIIKCVEALKLEPQFSVVSLRKRVTMLEKAKADKKKAAAATKRQNKRSRIGGRPPSRPTKATRTPNASYPSFYRQPPTPQIPAARHQFNLPMQGAYEGQTSAAAYGAAYTRSPSAVSQHYYMPEDIGGPGSGVPYVVPPVNYSGYDYSAGLAAPTQPSYPH